MKYLILFIIIGVIPVTSLAYNVYKTDDGTPIRWYKDTVSMVGDINGTADIPDKGEWQAVKAAMDAWNRETCKQPQLVFSGLKDDVRSGYWSDEDNYNLIKWVNDKKEWTDKYTGGEDVIAFTTVMFDLNSGEIYDTDMELNDWAFDFTIKRSMSKYDVQNTVTHELGHVLGMDHSKDPTATMYYSANKGDTNKRSLAEDDINGLCYLYGSDWIRKDVTDGETSSSELSKHSSGGCTYHSGTESPFGNLILLFGMFFFLKLRSRKGR